MLGRNVIKFKMSDAILLVTLKACQHGQGKLIMADHNDSTASKSPVKKITCIGMLLDSTNY